MGYIYKMINNITGECYVGQTNKSINQRLKDHYYASRDPLRKKTKIYKAIIKYGIDNFSIELLEKTNDMHEREKYYISLIKPDYNLSIGGRGTTGSGTRVFQYSINGDYITSYNSITLAAKAVGMIHSAISKCLRGVNKTGNGYRWTDTYFEKLSETKYKGKKGGRIT